jgi:hypothetical protein
MSRLGKWKSTPLPKSALMSTIEYEKLNAIHESYLSESTDSQVLPQNELSDLYWSLVHGLMFVVSVPGKKDSTKMLWISVVCCDQAVWTNADDLPEAERSRGVKPGRCAEN